MVDRALTVYVDRNKKLGHKVAIAFAVGCGGLVDRDAKPTDGPIATWGITATIRPLLVKAQLTGRRWIYLDHCYVGARYKYFRATDGRFQHNGLGENGGKRLDALKIKLRPWRKSGKHILVCPPGDLMCNLRGWLKPQDWIDKTLQSLRSKTDRPIVLRRKPSSVESVLPLAVALRDCHALVTHISNTALDAMIQGVPAIVTGDCAAAAICETSLNNIEDPKKGDRRSLFRVLANNQWTIAEMESGKCWKELNR